jgi:hypothetical protein
MRHIRFVTFAIAGLISLSGALRAEVDTAKAIRYFTEIREVCDQSARRLWDIDFCRYTLFIDPEDRHAVGYDLRRDGPITEDALFRGTWPEERTISNTTRFWKRRQWATIVWPPSDDRTVRTALIIHENFHGIQGILPYSIGRPVNPDHLDDRPGRLSLRMEARALARAIRTKGQERQEWANVAYQLRSKRLEDDERAVRAEKYWQLFEGIPEYTGHKLTKSDDELRGFLAERMTDLERRQTYTHDFAYFTTPAWAYLLDDLSSGWRADFRGNVDLAEFYAQAAGINDQALLTDEEFVQASIPLGYAQVNAYEERRQRGIDDIRSGYRERFVEGKVLVLTASSLSMDIASEVSLGKDGKYFRDMRISDRWGSLHAPAGGMLGPRPPWVYVEAVEENGNLLLSNDKWTLELNPGWEVREHERGYSIERE